VHKGAHENDADREDLVELLNLVTPVIRISSPLLRPSPLQRRRVLVWVEWRVDISSSRRDGRADRECNCDGPDSSN
jgi:hypothetical protein